MREGALSGVILGCAIQTDTDTYAYVSTRTDCRIEIA